MSDDGLSEHAELRERFAVAIAGRLGRGIYIDEDQARTILDEAQTLTTEAMKRRKRDNTKRLAEGTCPSCSTEEDDCPCI